MPTLKTPDDLQAIDILTRDAQKAGISLKNPTVRRTSSRFCLGVEHGDYNGTELFGVGTDRFIWLAYQPNGANQIRLFSHNFPDDGLIQFSLGTVPAPRSPQVAQTWGRFAFGVEYILRHAGYPLRQGIDAVIYGNIPGGGLSRSASLTLNLMLTLLAVNGIHEKDRFRIVELAQAVENDYIGSPCGQLDQIMILFAQDAMGTHYNPKTRSINYVPLGTATDDFRLVVLDTGTDRPGLEKSTYALRRRECQQLTRILRNDGYELSCLADVKDPSLYETIRARYAQTHPDLMKRLHYLYHAQQRFYHMLDAWKLGDIQTVGAVFRRDGHGLRDDYAISGPELESMCAIARTVPGVLGERMLGGGDKGASGALVLAHAVPALQNAVALAYPRCHPDFADKFAVHPCRLVQGVTEFNLQ